MLCDWEIHLAAIIQDNLSLLSFNLSLFDLIAELLTGSQDVNCLFIV